MCEWIIWLRGGSLAILVGLVIWIVVALVHRRAEEHRLRLIEILIGLGGLLIGVIGLTFDFRQPCYRLRITAPQPGNVITAQGNGQGAAQRSVFGTSRRVAEDL